MATLWNSSGRLNGDDPSMAWAVCAGLIDELATQLEFGPKANGIGLSDERPMPMPTRSSQLYRLRPGKQWL